jgi:hypothetical protein
MAKYDLTGSLEVSFTFAIGDKEFVFRKPTVREMRAVAKKFSVIDKETDPEKQVDLSDEAMAELYHFITSTGHDAKIADVMAEQPIGVQIAFNEMIKKELGAQE